MRNLLILLLAVALLGGCAGSANAYPVEWYWLHPVTGSPVEKYHFFISAGDTNNYTPVGGEITDITPGAHQIFRYDMPEDGLYYVRVAAEDSLTRIGRPSEAAEYRDDGAPHMDGRFVNWRKIE